MSRQKKFRDVSAELRSAARRLRHAATPAEAVLWEALRGGRLDGVKFRRQHAVGQVVFDFYRPASRLVVEVDGGVHDTDIRMEWDAARTAELEALGHRVLRFRDDEVLNALPAVLDRIRTAAGSSAQQHSAAHQTIPPLPQAGEGVRG